MQLLCRGLKLYYLFAHLHRRTETKHFIIQVQSVVNGPNSMPESCWLRLSVQMFVENLRQPENCLHTNKYEQTTTTFSCQTIILNCCCKSRTLLSAPHSKSKQSHLAFGSFHLDLVKNFHFHQNLAICGGKSSTQQIILE